MQIHVRIRPVSSEIGIEVCITRNENRYYAVTHASYRRLLNAIADRDYYWYPDYDGYCHCRWRKI